MMMSNQEAELLQYFQDFEDDDFESAALHRLSMLRLSSATPTPAPVSTFTTKHRPKFKKCSQCGTLKRRSPSSSLQEPSPKRATLHLASSSTTTTTAVADEKLNFQDCPNLSPPNSTTTTTLNIPASSPARQTPLHRCLSEPIYFQETHNSDAAKPINSVSYAAMGQELNPLSPENSKTGTNSPSPSSAVVSLPPLPAHLSRTISDPTGGNRHLVVAATTPPLPQAARAVTPGSPGSEESPNSKRLKRMKERMKEMSQWVGQVMREEEDHSSVDLHKENNSKDESGREHEEAVWVEKNGKGLIIHFKCPCGEGYGIFLCGNNCYYKLM